MAAESSNQQPTLSSLKFLVEKVIHTDASGTILRVGDQNSLGKQYAMKVISKGESGGEDDEDDDSSKRKGSTAPDPEAFAAAVERARCCAEASPKLGHPTALKYYDFRTKRNWLFQVNRAELLMELVSGLSLDKLKSPKLADLVLIAYQVSTGLAHMHRRKVIHGDVTPSHIMLSRAGQVKILGYGLSELKNRDHAGFSKRYAAPEQVKDKEISEKTDIYNFGATFYHLLVGKGKGGVNESGKMASPQSLNPRISTALNNLIVNCMKSAPDKRPDGMFDVSEILKKEAETMGIMENSLRGIAIPAE